MEDTGDAFGEIHAALAFQAFNEAETSMQAPIHAAAENAAASADLELAQIAEATGAMYARIADSLDLVRPLQHNGTGKLTFLLQIRRK
jgi:hypothetical protein